MDRDDFFIDAELSILFCKIIFSIQELENKIKQLAKKHCCNYNNSMLTSKCIDALNELIYEQQRDIMKQIIDLRNYIVHEFFYDNGKKLKDIKIGKYSFVGDNKKDFDLILNIIYEALDYIDNFSDNEQTKRPNIIENNYEINT